MKGIMRKLIYFGATAALAMSTSVVSAKVPVHINSGNPKYPFPQFLEYEASKLGNLGTQNPEGVVHAEMEQDIRDAWQIHANEFDYSGDELNGVKYIWRPTGDGKPYDCSESDGYTLLAAAYMADKVTFDGLWLFTHDRRITKYKRHIDGEMNYPTWEYQKGSLIEGDNQGAAPDGVYDCVLGLYVAWKQWGDKMGIKDASGEEISYRKDLIRVIRGLVEKGVFQQETNPSSKALYSGCIGFDGYSKYCDKNGEVTSWAYSPNDLVPAGYNPINTPERKTHVDYFAPAYYREFADILQKFKDEDDPELNDVTDEDVDFMIMQFRRCEASSDWVMGKLLEEGDTYIPIAGWVDFEDGKDDGDLTFSKFNEGEDFRLCWRTVLNYVWHGDPEYTWNHKTHKIENSSNTYELDVAKRFRNFLNSPQKAPWSNPYITFGSSPMKYEGPFTLNWSYKPDGSGTDDKFNFNWIPGTASASAVASQDYDLMAMLYRQCCIEWDVTNTTPAYLDSRPQYFHGWFRQLGMMVMTGNYPAPSAMNPNANMKIYRSLKDSTTCAYVGDNITYYLDYRNYGSLDATDVVIVEHVPEDFEFVSATEGGVYKPSDHTITWKIGTVAGFKSDNVPGPAMDLTSGNLAKTVGQVSYVAKVTDKASGRYCTTATISCSNGLGWTSNEYPNHITATMQRNCVDVINRTLKIEKKANIEMVNPGNLVKYSIDFENSSKEGWLDGGRPRVNVAFAHNGMKPQEGRFGFRLYNDAFEPYINYGNYRISYYLYDGSLRCLTKEAGCSVGWDYKTQICEFLSNGGVDGEVEVFLQKIVNGIKDGKKYNQRLVVRFPHALVTTTGHLYNMNGLIHRVHKGATVPLRLVTSLAPIPQTNIDFTDDWSYDPDAQDSEDGAFYPVSPSYQRINPETGESIETEVNEYIPCIVDKPSHTVTNVLVEEWDGFVWRRILGTGPTAGREYENVIIKDTLPIGMEFAGFEGKCPLEAFDATWDSYQIEDGRWVVKWEIPYLQREQKGKIVYNAKASFPAGKECPTSDYLTINTAWMSAKNESQFNDTAHVTITCAKVPDPIEKTTMVKSSDKEKYQIEDNITYTIEYEQTHGFVTKNATENVSDWTLSDGASISGGKVTCNQDSKAKYNYSYASNIYIEMDCESFSNELSFYLRDNIKVEIKKDWAKMTFICSENGTKKYEASIVSNANAFNLKLRMIDDILQIWMDKDTTDLADMTVDKLSKTPGFFSVGSGSYSNILVETDYAYNLSIVDRKPKEISFVSADNNGVLKGDSIVWTFEQGIDNPIPWGTKYTITWTGVVDECNSIIKNVVFADLKSYSHGEIGAQVINKCTSDDCEGVQKAELKFKDGKTTNTICDGDSAVLVAVGTPASNNYKYEFFLGSKSLGEASSADTFVVKEAGIYKVQISDPECSGSQPLTSSNDTLKVYDLPDADLDNAVICKNESLDLNKYTVDDLTIEWYADKKGESPIATEEIPGDDVSNTYFYVLSDDITGCKSDVKEWDVTIKPLPSSPIVIEDNKEYPLTDGVTKDITSLVKASDENNTVVWYEDDGITIKNTPISADLSNVGPQTFYVREKAGNCLSEPEQITIIVTNSQKPITTDTTICVTEEIVVASLVTNEEGTSLVWYDSDGNTIPDPGTYSSTKADSEKFFVAQKKGEAISDKVSFIITTVEVAKLKEDVEKFYCAGEEASDLKAEIDITACPTCKTPTSYNWYQGEDDVKITNLTPKTNVQELSIYYYKVEPVYKISENHSCVGSKVDYTVTVTFVPTAKPARPIMYTLSDAVGGVFPSLTDKDPGAIAPSDARSTLEWYTADGELIGEDGTVPPSPTMDMVDPASEVTTITYKVKQVKNGCKSAFEDVTVIITKTPTPKPEDANFCEGETPDAIENYVTFDPGYDPVWYDGDPLNGGMEVSTALTINTAADPGKAETVRKYFVAQRNSDGTSAAIPIKVTVYTKPKIKTYDKKSCGEPVSTLDLWDPVSRDVEDTHFYVGNTELPNKNTSITSTSSVTIIGYFYYKNKNELKECQSELSKVYIEIHDLGTVKIEPEGDYAICPNSAAELNVSITGANLEDSTLTYSWNKNNNAIEDGKFLSDPITEATTFSVTISDGVCTKTFEKKVGINPGKIDGHVEFTEANSDRPVTKELASSEGVKYYSCDEDVEISVDNVQGSDFVWDDRISGSSITKKGGIYNLTYKDANNCKTGFKIEIIPTPIIDYTVPFDSTLCEGENVTLTANLISGTEAADIVWIKDDTDEISTDASLVLKKVTSENSGKYTYKAISKDKRCKSFGSFGTLNVLPRPTYKIKEVEPICAGNSQQIGLETLTPSTAKVEWAPNPTLTPGTITADVTPEDNETYSFTISQDGGCKITEDISVTVVQPIDFKINANDTILCENNIGNLKFGLKIAEGDVLSYEWKNDKDSVVSSSSVMRFNEKTIGTYNYKVTLTSEACPPAFDNIQVTIASVPIIDTVNLIDYHNVEIVPNTTYGEAPYEYKVDANEFSSEENVKVSYGHHTAVIRDNNGCMNTYEFDTEAPSFEIPIVVTPNNDGVNDKFISQVIAEAYPDAVVTIYDRFGKKLTEIKGNESWDGTYQGHKMPTTDYWYEIWIEEIRKKYVGHFTLIND